MPSDNLLFWACSFQRFKNRFFTKFSITKTFFAFGVILLYTLPTLDDVQAAGRSVDQKIIKRDFMRVVMSAEYGGNSKFGRSVKKYNTTVRFAIINHSKQDRRHTIKKFVRSLPKKIAGLKTSVVSSSKQANFRIHVVDKDQYADVIRNNIYGCLLYTSPSPRDLSTSRMPSSA